MPVRSLNSSVFKWPELEIVVRAVRSWADQLASRHRDVTRIAYFGSYARGDWGVGSDLDLLLVVAQTEWPFHRRAAQFDVGELPVQADLLVYTEAEWQAMGRDTRFRRMLLDEAVWLRGSPD